MKSSLQLDFIHQPAFSLSHLSAVSILVFLPSLIVAFFTWQLYSATKLDQNEISLKLSQMSHQSARVAEPHPLVKSDISPEQIQQVQTAVGALILPWDTLLQGIEKSDMQDIALLTLEPNVKKQLVTISGEAKNLQTALAYIQKLELQPVLDKVYLQKYSVDEANAFKPVKFTISAQWLF